MAKLLPVNPMMAAFSAPSQVGVPPESHVTPAYAPTADAVAMAVSTVAPLTPIAAPHIPKTAGQATMMIAHAATTATAVTAAAINPFSSGLLEFNQHDVASLTPRPRVVLPRPQVRQAGFEVAPLPQEPVPLRRGERAGDVPRAPERLVRRGERDPFGGVRDPPRGAERVPVVVVRRVRAPHELRDPHPARVHVARVRGPRPLE